MAYLPQAIVSVMLIQQLVWQSIARRLDIW